MFFVQEMVILPLPQTKTGLHNMAYKQGSFVFTDNPDDLPLILLDDVELVILRQKTLQQVKDCMKQAANDISLSKENMTLHDRKTLDGKRIIVPASGKHKIKGIEPLQKERSKLRNLIKRSFRLATYDLNMMKLAIQKASRKAGDNVFHRDFSAGMRPEELPEYERIIATCVHEGKGTEFIPIKDAGIRIEDPRSNESFRQIFPNYKSLDNLVAPKTGSIAVFKAGKNGAVHRGPSKGRGLRWWSFFQTILSYKEIKRGFTKSELRKLQTRFNTLPKQAL